MLENILFFLAWALYLYSLVLIARVVLDWVLLLAGRWRPKGIMLVIANIVYGLTDPPLAVLHRFIPPLRLGPVALDVGFIVLFIAISLLLSFVRYLSFLV